MVLTGNSEFKKSTQTIEILKCDNDFDRWYLQHHDFSIFSKEEIREVLCEERPKYYPCVPLISESQFNISFLGLDVLDDIFTVLEKEPK